MIQRSTALNRRHALQGVATLAALLPAARLSAGKAAPDLEAHFRKAFAVAPTDVSGLVAARLAFIANDAMIVDHDVPFPLDRAGYADHLAFRATNADRLELKLYEVKALTEGTTGTVSAYFVERSKPKNAGFRLRSGYCTAVCARDGQEWRAIGFHMGALIGQITDASPG